MSKLVRAPSPQPVGPRTRVLIVRQPVRSVGRQGEPSRGPMRLALAVVIVVAALLLLWMLGMLGHRLGYAVHMRVPELVQHPTAAFANGVRMIINVPETIIQAGVYRVGWLLLAFLAIAAPAGGLAASQPYVAGGPRQSQLAVTFSWIGAIAASLNALLIVWWTASGARRALIGELPFSVDNVEQWLQQLRTAAGLDALALFAAVLWLVLLLRITLPTWLKALSVTLAVAGAVIAFAGFAVTAGCVAGVETPRSVCMLETEVDDTHLLIGSTDQQIATAHVEFGNVVMIQLTDRPSTLNVLDSMPVTDFLKSQQ